MHPLSPFEYVVYYFNVFRSISLLPSIFTMFCEYLTVCVWISLCCELFNFTWTSVEEMTADKVVLNMRECL